LVDTGEPQVTPVDGRIGLVCVGMSNANQECSAFISLVNGTGAAGRNPQVVVVNCAVGGHAIERWIDPAFDDALWDDCLTRRIPQAGLRPEQVRVLYHKAANQFTSAAGGGPLPVFPGGGSDYDAFRSNLAAFAARVPTKFPSVQAVYTSSRSYGGFSGSFTRGEPLSYEEGHALNAWLDANDRVGGVWYGWGAYLWAPDCGTGVTNGGSLCYVRDDYVADGVHPSTQGRSKIAEAMHQMLRTHSWYGR
jgi:lysophospholipase L1-like esterase